MTTAYTPHDVAILIPVLGRPHHIPPLLASIDATAPGARVVFLVTPGDDDGIAACLAAGREVVTVRWKPAGDYQRKVNTGYRHTTEPLLFVGATDLEFTPGWFEAACAALGPGIGLVGTNDMCNPRVMAGEHATHFLVTRAYADGYGTIDQPGAILHEGYVHEYCDTEAVGTAKYRGAFAMASNSVVRHKHILCGQSPDVDDPIYAGQRERMAASWPLFRRRRRMWGVATPVARRRVAGRRQ